MARVQFANGCRPHTDIATIRGSRGNGLPPVPVVAPPGAAPAAPPAPTTAATATPAATTAAASSVLEVERHCSSPVDPISSIRTLAPISSYSMTYPAISGMLDGEFTT
ncbi:hypothetical protein E1292_10160 [Nonomuraea deserti]|uniref:Uncharacterized protein n=1 Tax=Nonomuraea deserti TaxID=1848322 RepID=A0A4R4VTU4_9ACTN|nr:hypothetical protein E1292_10160 [Nonomuraea deserti]